jgi:hypothetical protein
LAKTLANSSKKSNRLWIGAQFEQRPATLIALAFGGGIVLSALLPNRHSRHRSRDSYDDDSRRNNRIQRRLAQERIAQERVA